MDKKIEITMSKASLIRFRNETHSSLVDLQTRKEEIEKEYKKLIEKISDYELVIEQFTKGIDNETK